MKKRIILFPTGRSAKPNKRFGEVEYFVVGLDYCASLQWIELFRNIENQEEALEPYTFRVE
jgi:hypothetical protein